mgnify:CR=1 FL=1
MKIGELTLSDIIREALDNLTQIVSMYQLNLELLEELDAICEWILKNNIEIPNKDKLCSFLRKAKTLLNEIHSSTPFLQHRFKTPKDSTEPIITFEIT